ncbi:Abi family protein [Corynebacterium mendelii]|uniref:Abi family protein n=1 Tax=Corynebacterium mendelii TaxID=2765362 RepID=UPI003672F5D4
MTALKRIGYYRLSAYSYPFRLLLPPEQRETETNFRSEKFKQGVKFETVIQLADFDSKLRRLIFEAIEEIEIVLCTRVAYIAGRVAPFMHEKPASLDAERCRSKVTQNGKEITRWKAWKNKFKTLKAQARNEDYYKHFEQKYDGKMPIWVAIEFIDFGGMARLFKIMPTKVQSDVAKLFNVRSGATFSKWLVALNYLRNKVAHHNRLWNRKMTYSLQVPNVNEVTSELEHLRSRDSDLNSTYDYIAVVAYLMSSISPQSHWNHEVCSLMESFPVSPHVSPENDMGFPPGWRLLNLWS